jgi:phosphate transport system protein
MNNEAHLSGHISKRFDQELEDIRNRVLTMGGLVETQVNNGVKCLIESDSELARQVVAKDKEINRMEMEIDHQCLQILARRQPAASDLRLVVAIIKTIADLERIGDQAQKLGKHQLELVDVGVSASTFVKIEHLGDLVSKNLNLALDAFARMNVKDAMETISRDTKVNDEFESLMRELITHMMEDPRTIRGALRVSWSARALERIGDHANNICEYVVFLVQGKDVRHIDAIDKLDL